MARHFIASLVGPALLFFGFAAGPSLAQIAEPPTSADEISQEDFFVEGDAPVRKPGSYDVTIVYFFDYQCPSCRNYTPDVEKVLREERRVRVIYRDTPIFGPRSDEASRLAIASRYQGRHEAFHHQLMTAKLPLDEAAIRAAADKAGVDWARLQRDAAAHAEEISLQIVRNLELHQAAGIAGTPAFIVHDTLANGALDYAGLKAEIADARASIAKLAPAPMPDAPPVEEGQADDGAEAAGDAAVNDSAAEADAVAAPMFRPSPASEPGELAATMANERPIWPWLAGAVGALVVIAGAILRRRRKS